MICALLLPLIIIYLLIHDPKTLKSPNYRNRYGALYNELKLNNRYEAAYYLMFLFRRIIFLSVVFFGDEIPIS